MQSLLPKDDEPIKPIQPPQQQAQPQYPPPQGYNYPPPNYPPPQGYAPQPNYPPQGQQPTYPPQGYAPQPQPQPVQSAPVNYLPPPADGSNLKMAVLMG